LRLELNRNKKGHGVFKRPPIQAATASDAAWLL